jgi:hypothetical protein
MARKVILLALCALLGLALAQDQVPTDGPKYDLLSVKGVPGTYPPRG